MDIGSRLREITEKMLTARRNRIWARKERSRRRNPILDWLGAFLWAALVVLLINQYLFQAYRIPSGSMIPTFLIGDNIFVNKLVYGPELLPGIGKLSGFREVQRNDLIIFDHPEYISKGSFYTVTRRLIYMLTFSLVDIERIQSGTLVHDLLTKRVIGIGGDRIRYDEGEVLVLPAGGAEWLDPAEFQRMYDVHFTINRLAGNYGALKEAVRLNAWARAGLIDIGEAEERLKELNTKLRSQRDENNILIRTYDRLQGEREVNRTSLSLYPGDYRVWSESAKQQKGWYVPESRILPIGDNRDDSYDGRYFGPVLKEDVLGQPAFRFWPIPRLGALR